MSHKSLRTLYRQTMDGLSPSADRAVESLRRRWAKGELHEFEVSPEKLASLSDRNEIWAGHTFLDLERNGFVDHNYRHFLWSDASPGQTAQTLDVLAGIETAVLLRTQLIGMGKVQSELDHRHGEILEAAKGGSPLAAVLTIQRYFTTLVVSIGSQELMRRYAALNRVSLCYAWAQQLQPSSIEDLCDWMVQIPKVIVEKDGSKAARMCHAIKCLPFGAHLPDLAAA